jgi:hypothetical protein
LQAGRNQILTNFAIFNFLTAESETESKPAHNIAAHRYGQVLFTKNIVPILTISILKIN